MGTLRKYNKLEEWFGKKVKDEIEAPKTIIQAHTLI